MNKAWSTKARKRVPEGGQSNVQNKAKHTLKEMKISHLKQGTIRLLSKAFDGFLDKLIIFEPIMWLGQIHGPIFIVTVCLPIVQGGWQNQNN